MSDKTKVTVSAGELALAADRDIILTKRAVIEKASALFNSLIPEINNVFGNTVSSDKELSGSIPKISKGENYLDLPYVILDYPSSFKKGNIFTVRTMFLWGRCFSIQMHLSGNYINLFREKIFKNLSKEKDFFIAAGEKEWEHHFEAGNYLPYSSLSADQQEAMMEKGFFKIALKYELHHWNMMQSILPEGYRKINSLLNP